MVLKRGHVLIFSIVIMLREKPPINYEKPLKMAFQSLTLCYHHRNEY